VERKEVWKGGRERVGNKRTSRREVVCACVRDANSESAHKSVHVMSNAQRYEVPHHLHFIRSTSIMVVIYKHTYKHLRSCTCRHPYAYIYTNVPAPMLTQTHARTHACTNSNITRCRTLQRTASQ